MTKPKLRFPQFSEDWEQRKFSEEVSFFNGLTYSPSDITDSSGTLVLRSSNVKNGEIVLEDNVYVKKEKATSTQVLPDDIIVVVRNGSRSLIGKHALVKFPLHDTVIGAFMTGIRSAHPDFITALMDTGAFSKTVSSDMGATINQITGRMFREMTFRMPISDSEKRKLGSLFRALDDTITLHQRKLEKLKTLKKGLLQKLFPKNNERQPELRFPGFTEDWEQRKFKEILESVSFKTFLVRSKPGPYPVIQQGASPLLDFGDGTPYSNFEDVVLFGDHTLSIFKPREPFLLASDGLKILKSKLILGSFLGYQLERYAPKPEGYKRHYGILLEQICCFPTSPEQERISGILSNLDLFITLHQRKLEKLKELKKGLLQQMFV